MAIDINKLVDSGVKPSDLARKDELEAEKIIRQTADQANALAIAEETERAIGVETALSARVSAHEGLGGSLTAYDFGVATPTQQVLTNYALSQITSITNPLDIWDKTWVTNNFDGSAWQLNNTPSTDPPIFEWVNIGSPRVALATDFVAGTIKGGEQIKVNALGELYTTPEAIGAATVERVEDIAADLAHTTVYTETSTSATTRTVVIPGITSYDDMLNKVFWINSQASNSGAFTCTLNVNGLGAKQIFAATITTGVSDMASRPYSIRTGILYGVIWNNVRFYLVNPQTHSTGTYTSAETGALFTKTGAYNLYTELNTNKQSTLVSGTNIKTINGESLLGSGDITINSETTEKVYSSILNLVEDTPINITLPISTISKNILVKVFANGILDGIETENVSVSDNVVTYIPSFTGTDSKITIFYAG